MGLETIIAFVIANRKIIAEIAAIAAIACLIWWFGIHNPKVIKEQQTKIEQQQREIQARDNAINMLGNIERAHDVITRQTFRTISSIRYTPKPSRTGQFYSDRLPWESVSQHTVKP